MPVTDIYSTTTIRKLAYLSMQSAENRRKNVTILVTLTSRNDSDFETSNVSLRENKPNGVNPNFNDIDCYVRKNEGKIQWSSAD